MFFCKNSIAKTIIVSRNARRVLISVWGLIFCLYNNVTGLCTRLRENDFHTITGHARAFGFAVAVNKYELDKKRYPSSTQR